MINNKRILSVFILVLILSGCFSIPSSVPTSVSPEIRKQNRENLVKLKLGNSKLEVLEIMGYPQGSATFPRYAKHLDYWIYHTDISKIILNQPDEYYTYLAFEGEKLVAIGAGHEVIPFNNKHPLWRADR